MGNCVGDMLTTMNGYAFYDLSYRTVFAKPTVMVTVVPRMMYTAQQRWEQEARPAYKAVVERWEAVKLSRASAAELLVGTREILNAAASYYLTIQSGILPAAYLTEAIFTMVYEKFLKRRADPSALTFMLGYDSAPIRAEKSLYDLAQWVRTQDDLSTVLQNMVGSTICLSLSDCSRRWHRRNTSGQRSASTLRLTSPNLDTPSTISTFPNRCPRMIQWHC